MFNIFRISFDQSGTVAIEQTDTLISSVLLRKYAVRFTLNNICDIILLSHTVLFQLLGEK